MAKKSKKESKVDENSTKILRLPIIKESGKGDTIIEALDEEVSKTFDEHELIPVEVVNTSDNPLPKYQTSGSVGMDVMASEGVTILPGETQLVHTGIYMDIPDGFEVQVRARSGLALNSGIQVGNGVGTIDSDYRGECNVILHNSSKEIFKIVKGDRIGQFVLSRKPRIEWIKVKKLKSTKRGTGGFGSSGK